MAKFKKGEKKPENSGRKKGSVNKITKTVREVVLAAFNELQEDKKANIINWAKENPTDFYKVASKLIPTEITGKDGGDIITRVEIVEITKAKDADATA